MEKFFYAFRKVGRFINRPGAHSPFANIRLRGSLYLLSPLNPRTMTQRRWMSLSKGSNNGAPQKPPSGDEKNSADSESFSDFLKKYGSLGGKGRMQNHISGVPDYSNIMLYLAWALRKKGGNNNATGPKKDDSEE